MSGTSEDAVIGEAKGALDGFSSQTRSGKVAADQVTSHQYIENPVLISGDVSEYNAAFVADPIWYRGDSLFEVTGNGNSDIGRATFEDYSG
ncbi:hypothetical protein [Salinirussus salinus]|uniref:hypothetical protein n=1 Tax=Salinirussus salinus TaxID=1198300 RepID=UPI001356C3A7|nr:hypothetical protein [Salinirussus salinus]